MIYSKTSRTCITASFRSGRDVKLETVQIQIGEINIKKYIFEGSETSCVKAFFAFEHLNILCSKYMIEFWAEGID